MLRFSLFIVVIWMLQACNSTDKSIDFTSLGYNLYQVPDSFKINGEVFMKPENEAVYYFDYTRRPPYVEVSLRSSVFHVKDTRLRLFHIDVNNNNRIDFGGVDKIGFGPVANDSILLDEINSWIYQLHDDELVLTIDNSTYRFSSVDGISLDCEFLRTVDFKSGEDQYPSILSNLRNINTKVMLESGEKVAFSSFYKKKPLVLDFWFSRCGGCIREFPVVNAYASKDDIDYLGANAVDDLGEILDDKERFNLVFPQIKVSKSFMNALGNRGYYPSKVIFESDGTLYRNFGKLHDLEILHDSYSK